MTRARRIVAGSFLAFALFIAYLSLELDYYGADLGPGAGFVSFWLAVLLAAFSVGELTNIAREAPSTAPQSFLPDKEGRSKILMVTGALIGVVILIEQIGYTFTIFMFCLFLLSTLGTSLMRAVAISLVTSVGTYILFGQLQVLLPKGPLGF
jgi:hypothetical protein